VNVFPQCHILHVEPDCVKGEREGLLVPRVRIEGGHNYGEGEALLSTWVVALSIVEDEDCLISALSFHFLALEDEMESRLDSH
jgi:hypothetical protein